MKQLHNNAPLSRAQLAQSTGLNKSTISSLVEELIARGLVHEIGQNSSGAGRPAILLELDEEAGCIIGVDLGVDSISVALTSFKGNILWRESDNIDPEEAQEKIIRRVLSLASKAVKAGRAQDLRLLGLGLSVPGTVDIEKGMLVYAPNLNWRNVSLKKIFAENTGLNVFIDNDANAAATAEHLFGKARRSLHFIFVFLGRGVGAGLFLNGELYRGRDGFAGEIGHSPIMSEPFYLRCQCGRYGCWETYANQQSIIRRVKERLDGKKDSLIPRLMAEKKEPLSVALIKQAADMGDALALDAFIDAGHAIGLGAASLINTYNPEMIVFGGPLSTVGDFILPAIKNSVGQHSDIEMSQQVDITFSEFGADASVKGAIAMVVDHILSNPTCISNKEEVVSLPNNLHSTQSI